MTNKNWLTQAVALQAHPSWHEILGKACQTLPTDYIDFLATHEFLPGRDKIFSAFSLPLTETHYILYGESPYPRKLSANGFAFWDGAVNNIWSDQGLSKTVNRATSLRNILKMLLITYDFGSPQTIEANIKNNLVQTLDELFENFLHQGFLLLNASLSLSALPKNLEAKYWLPFHEVILDSLNQRKSHIKLILFGKIAEKILALPQSQSFPKLIAEHPYNISFITQPEVQKFFKPLKLLARSRDHSQA